MNPDRLKSLLAEVAARTMSPAEALSRLAELPFADLEFAKLDLHRELRTGHPEVVYGAGKRWEDLVPICRRFAEAHGRFLVTRLAAEVGDRLAAEFPGAMHHERARIVTLGGEAQRAEGEIALLAAGTSDLPVAEEAAVCLEHFGHRVVRFTDVGVAGLHRLLARGLTYKQVAERLVVSVKTVETHASRVLAKLGLQRRELPAASSNRPKTGSRQSVRHWCRRPG